MNAQATLASEVPAEVGGKGDGGCETAMSRQRLPEKLLE